MLISHGVPPIGGLQLDYTASRGFVSDCWAFLLPMLCTDREMVIDEGCVAVTPLHWLSSCFSLKRD